MLCLFLGTSQIRAAHILGGEITYRCLGNGMFEFTVVVIRDCGNALSPGFHNGFITLSGPISAVSLPLVSSVDLSPRCATNLSLNCNPPQNATGAPGSLAKFVFRGNVNLSNLGPTPQQGYTFSAALPCCRGEINNSNANNGSLAIQVKMFPFIDPSSSTRQAFRPSQLCDVSPVFMSDPMPVFVVNPFDTIHYQAMASDSNSTDSLVYAIEPPYSSSLVPFAFTAPYSLSRPIPGLLDSTLLPAAYLPIHPNSGELVFRPIIPGSFAFSLKVTAYRSGQKIAEIRRETSFKVIPNPAGSPYPFVPMGAESPFSQRAPVILPPAKQANGQGSFEVKVYAGDTLNLPHKATDFYPTIAGLVQDPNTWVGVAQQISLAVTGDQLSTQNSTSTGCDLPPCVTLRGAFDAPYPQAAQQPPTIQTRGNGLPIGLGYATPIEVGARLVWPTTCQDLADSTAAGGYAASREVRLALHAFDENCPIEGYSSRPLSLQLVPPPPPAAPVLLGITRVNGRNALTWSANIDTLTIDPLDTLNAPQLSLPGDAAVALAKSVARRKRLFAGIRVFKSLQLAGPYVEVAFVTGNQSITWEDTSAQLGSHYYLQAVSNCMNAVSGSSDTLSACQSNLQLSILQGTNLRFCQGSSFSLQSNYTGNLPIQWYWNNLPLPFANASSLNVTQAGTYVMGVIDSASDCITFSNALDATQLPPPFNDDGPCMVGIPAAGLHPRIFLQKTLGMNTAEHQIYRENPQSGLFEWIATVPLAGPSAHLDQTVLASERAHRYRIEVVDSCGFRAQPSETHATIHLQAAPLSGSRVGLEWTPFEGVNFSHYQVMRNQGGTWQSIGQVSPTATTFADSTAQSGAKVYGVYAALWASCPANLAGQYHLLDGSWSNWVEIGAGLSTEDLEVGLKLFPNPSGGIFQISATVPMSRISILDAMGRLVLVVEPMAAQAQIDLTAYSDGLYTAVIEQPGGVSRHKLLLRR